MIKKLNRLTELELDIILEIWLHTNIDAHNFIMKEYWLNNYELVKEQLPLANIYAYYDNDSLVAFMGIIDTYIAGIFVLKELQEKGIGSKLLEKAKEDNTSLSLKVYERNENALSFYLSKGFKVIEESIDVDTNEVELLMKWSK